ncbi:uncharacterized protein TM35_000054780 [Trypanosoma theileri]|uniref:Uncharacterized protein n=1 Tax=Trypanosoma theileri TaxID=67003 RepID=A0A1X0P4M5_9TRYP|nr:uncharacterized protein TM35_000054780 [Trypanosoma theileri]ORC91882.1 hypothetical protein TM35_000054780 [Trypanosoma theileri]
MCPNTAVTRPSRARRRETHGTRKTENSPPGAGLGRAPRGPPREHNMFFCGCFGYDRTWPNAPYPVRFVKLSGHRPRWYGDRWWCWNPGAPYPPQLFFCQHLGVGAVDL